MLCKKTSIVVEMREGAGPRAASQSNTDEALPTVRNDDPDQLRSYAV